MAIDPYSTPSTDVLPPSYAAAGMVTQGVIRQLTGTKPWVRLISVMMFIGTGLMVIAAVAMMLVGGTIFSSAKLGTYQSGMGVGIGVAYLIFAVLYLYPSVKLWKYASRIGTLLASGQAMDLESALNE